MDVFKIENINFTYPDANEPTLKNINLSIRKGEFIVLFGESGSGKTTLLKLLKKELTPHGQKTGNIYYKSETMLSLNEHTSTTDIGFVMQNHDTQIVTDKVWHELAFGLENLGVNSAEIRRRIGEIASYFGIHHWFHKKMTDLSGGQKQLINLASVLVMEPEVLLLDEPTAQLDPISSKNFLNIIETLNRDFGLTILLVEHELENVLHIADRIVLLDGGKIIYDGIPRKIANVLKGQYRNHPMASALPAPVRVFSSLENEGDSPLTIREGIDYLQSKSIKPLFKEENAKNYNQNSRVLELKDVWFRYERNTPDILAGVNIQVYKGEVVSILGGNGAGKTTLLQVMSGQRRAYKGKVLVHNKKIQKYKGKELYRNNIALLPQDPLTLFYKNTIREDYKTLCKAHQYPKEKIEQKIRDVSNSLNIHSLLDRHPADISGGELQKVALGKLLLLEPKIIFLDEPTKGIDAFWKVTFRGILQKLRKEQITIILVTHDIEFAAHVSNRVGLFFDNDIISIDSPREFFRKNNYYTTAVSLMTRHLDFDAMVVEDIIKE